MNQYIERRKRLAEKMQEDSVCYIFSGTKIMMGNDESYPFVIDKNFLYLTGIDQEGLVLKLAKNKGVYSETLYLLPYDEILAKWVGGRIREEEARAISCVTTVRDVSQVEDDFGLFYSNVARLDENFTVYLDLYRYHFNDGDRESMRFANKLKDRYPQIKLHDIFSFMQQLRWIKDELEVEETKKAIEITREGIYSMMRVIKPGLNERVVEGIFNFNLCKHLSSNAFKSICASGKRATILHYNSNNQIVKDGELFLCDLGATNNYYQADISRVFPVNGKFSERQKVLYELVLKVQKKVEAAAKPGVTLSDLNQIVIDFYQQELPKHGLNKDVREYYFHGVSHQLGLDTHDLSSRVPVVLQEGMIITNEPGLYVEDEEIGIRIEDDLLITADGCVNLSKDIMKEVEEIETFMSK